MIIDSNRDVSFVTDQGRFKYRVASVILHENRVLLMTEDRFDFWYLPGGKVSLFETSQEALVREVKEELGDKVLIHRMLWTTESLYHFEAWDTYHHDLIFYYLCELPQTSEVLTNDKGTGTELFSNEKTTLHYQWFPIDKLEDLNLVPEFLKEGLNPIPERPTHLILNEL